MNLNNLLNQFLGSTHAVNDPNQRSQSGSTAQGIGDALGQLGQKIPGGLMGGAAAGGIVALLMGSKKARKYAGKAASYGGAAVLGGLAFKAYQNWKNNNQSATDHSDLQTSARNEQDFHHQALQQGTNQAPFELTLIKGMIAAAKADGHIDANEQSKIFDAVERLQLSPEDKGMIFDMLRQSISIAELAQQADSLETRSELYLASCLVLELDHPAERAHLDQLGSALQLPRDLTQHLEHQAQQALQD